MNPTKSSKHSRLYLLIIILLAVVYCCVIYFYSYRNEIDDYVYATVGRRLPGSKVVDSVTVSINNEGGHGEAYIVQKTLFIEHYMANEVDGVIRGEESENIEKISQSDFDELSQKINNSGFFEIAEDGELVVSATGPSSGRGEDLDYAYKITVKKGNRVKSEVCKEPCSDRLSSIYNLIIGMWKK